MPAATDEQVQRFVNERFRPFAEAMRAIYIKTQDHKAAIDDIYDALDPPENATWTDTRTDGPPTLLEPTDVLAWNAFMSDFIAFIEGNAQWPVVLDACVRAPEG